MVRILTHALAETKVDRLTKVVELDYSPHRPGDAEEAQARSCPLDLPLAGPCFLGWR